MKTVIIYDQCFERPVSFYIVEGDLSHLNGVYGNHCNYDEKLQNELFKHVFDSEWNQLPALSEFPVQAVKDGAIVIVCGFLP